MHTVQFLLAKTETGHKFVNGAIQFNNLNDTKHSLLSKLALLMFLFNVVNLLSIHVTGSDVAQL